MPSHTERPGKWKPPPADGPCLGMLGASHTSTIAPGTGWLVWASSTTPVTQPRSGIGVGVGGRGVAVDVGSTVGVAVATGVPVAVGAGVVVAVAVGVAV